MAKVLDASALITYLEKEPGYKKVKELFIKAMESGESLLMTTVNWGEVFYILVRDYGLEGAMEVHSIIETFPVDFVPPDLALAKEAAIIKANKKLPYVDCFAAALARINSGELITGDKDFKIIADEITIAWI